MVSILKVGARPSRLAINQVEEIARLVPFVAFDVMTIDTAGDRDKLTPLSEAEDARFFTKEIENALIAGEIDVAIHSAKDLDWPIPEGLEIAATTRSVSRNECLVSRKGQRLDELPTGALVGTSSKKRKEAVLKYRPDLVIKDIRGNIDERLGQLDRGDFDAIVVAQAALIRLGYEAKIAQIIPEYIIEPHPLQGSLAIEIRKDRIDLLELFRGIDA